MRTHEGQAKTLKEEDFQRVIDHTMATSRHAERDVALLQVSYRAALRVNEIAGLSLDDVLTMDGQLEHAVTLRKKTTKGNKGGKAFLSHPAVRDALMAYVVIRSKKTISSRTLFISQKGTAFTGSTLSRLFTTLYKKAGAYGCSSHAGRRSSATNLMRGGANIYQIKQILRHENIQTTARYIEEDEETLAKLMRNV